MIVTRFRQHWRAAFRAEDAFGGGPRDWQEKSATPEKK
jgi:hypothetical protein